MFCTMGSKYRFSQQPQKSTEFILNGSQLVLQSLSSIAFIEMYIAGFESF